ncbi:hypothetical protein RQ769_14475 [Roseomonas mucosa]|uniref:type IVB secretion system protein IcmW n=1 Tax=Roseomonas mucosa TaxID=207340 RepID=UPI0028CE129F|nr:hypothetical protein [Roseomonas mucosa]MDT8350998.1 hypothetical protein [Roseomonas mucosa]
MPVFRPLEDTPEVRALLSDLGRVLEATSPERVGGSIGEDDGATAREVLAQLGVARMLRLVEWLDGVAGGAAGDVQALLLRSDTTEAGRFIRTVLDALHRQELLARIFAPERLQALLSACGESAKEAA